MSHTSSPQYDQMADESMIRCLNAQARAIWPLERPLFDRYDVLPGQHILDLGCGTGEITSRLAEQFPGVRVTGVDLVDSHLTLAHQRYGEMDGRLDFQIGDAMNLGFENHRFDISVCRHLLQAIPDQSRVLGEMLRVTRPGGWLHLLAEDYGMMHFHHADLDIDAFWRDGVWRFGELIGTDLRSGRKIYSVLRKLGVSDIQIDYLPVDTLRADRSTLSMIFEAWRDGYAQSIADHTGFDFREAKAHFEAMMACCLDLDGYVLWQVPIIAVRVPE